jgi:hypothetical protein
MNALSKPKPAAGRAELPGRGPTTGPEGENTMTAINPISSMTSTSSYQPTASAADGPPKQEAVKKAHHHGGHHKAPAPAPAPTTPGTSTSTSSILDVTA